MTTLQGLKIDLQCLPAFDSEATRSVVDLINAKLDRVAGKVNEIRRRIGEQNSHVRTLIQENQRAINNFLKSAGYRYKVRIEATDGTYRMLLEHKDAAGHIEEASKHLSYGEKNAFALVLFMYDMRREEPDLVVLDDPVSSFDKVKKFAIIHELFRGEKSLRGMTSLFLTHDIEPAVDIVRIDNSFEAAKPVAHFLVSADGQLTEKPIKPTDIKTFFQIWDDIISSDVDHIIKCIYLRRRFEVHGDRGLGYDLLSSALHGRPVPTRRLGRGEQTRLSEAEISKATQAVQEHIPDFDYDELISELEQPGLLKSKFEATSAGYEKVQLARILLERSKLKEEGIKRSSPIERDRILEKFLNETHHIENEYVMQLDPREFDAVPEFIIERCVDFVEAYASH